MSQFIYSFFNVINYLFFSYFFNDVVFYFYSHFWMVIFFSVHWVSLKIIKSKNDFHNIVLYNFYPVVTTRVLSDIILKK